MMDEQQEKQEIGPRDVGNINEVLAPDVEEATNTISPTEDVVDGAEGQGTRGDVDDALAEEAADGMDSVSEDTVTEEDELDAGYMDDEDDDENAKSEPVGGSERVNEIHESQRG